jgi:hypothetical protein
MNERNLACAIGEHGELLCMQCCRVRYPAIARQTVSRESLIVAQLDLLLAPKLGNWLVQDCVIPGQSCLKFRPDVLYELLGPSGQTRWLWIEVDEGGVTHEQRVARIELSMASRDVEDAFVVRVNPDVLFQRKTRTRDGRTEIVWEPLKHFLECMDKVAAWVLACATSTAPLGAEERTKRFFFM